MCKIPLFKKWPLLVNTILIHIYKTISTPIFLLGPVAWADGLLPAGQFFTRFFREVFNPFKKYKFLTQKRRSYTCIFTFLIIIIFAKMQITFTFSKKY